MNRKIFKRIWEWKRIEVVPGTEPLNGVKPQKLKRGRSYLVKEPKSELSIEIFASLIKSKCPQCGHPEAFPCESIGCEKCTLPCPCKDCTHTRAQGLCFTMHSPEDVRRRYLLQTTPIFWMSNCGSNSISPSNLEQMADMINEFLRKSGNPVVLLDGVEYMIVVNGFNSVIKFLHDIREWAIMHKAILILPISPSALGRRELALVERSMDEFSLVPH